MHDQHLAAREMSAEVLRAALEPLHALTDQPRDEAVGEREAQVGAALLDTRQTVADERRLQAAPHRFHLWEFRHEADPSGGDGAGNPARLSSRA
jgi:hypothetical protein